MVMKRIHTQDNRFTLQRIIGLEIEHSDVLSEIAQELFAKELAFENDESGIPYDRMMLHQVRIYDNITQPYDERDAIRHGNKVGADFYMPNGKTVLYFKHKPESPIYK